ncbi:J domain-containing protein [Microbacterium sp. LWO12-1.2]|uniref:J domain-containing protein n=1 Tax=Microbacterium sp. LWO12-1.2 TaxID=3135261 RepID=UPI00341B01BD
MSNSEISLYEVLEVSPTAGDDAVREAIHAARRKWQSRSNHPNLAQRQVAEQRVAAIAEAERVLLDPASRAQYDHSRSVPQQSSNGGAPRLVIPATGATTSAKIDLLRVVNVSQPSPGPFVPVLNADKSPVMAEGENYLQHLTGEGGCFYQPWPSAPVQDASPGWGNTTLYFTDQRLIFICPNFVRPKDSSVEVDTDLGLGVAIMAAGVRGLSQAGKNAAAARAVAGKAMAASIPWEYIVEVEVWPDVEYGGAALIFTMVGGDATYSVGLGIEVQDLSWFRQQAEWAIQVALHRRLELLGDGVLPSERAAVQAIQANPRPDYGQDGSLSYIAPVALDAGNALTRL